MPRVIVEQAFGRRAGLWAYSVDALAALMLVFMQAPGGIAPGLCFEPAAALPLPEGGG